MTLTEHTTLADVQSYMRSMADRHGFTTDPHRQMNRITAEVGELADVVVQVSQGQLEPADFACREEFADVLITLAGLANILGVDLAEAFAAKVAVNATRTWDLGREPATTEEAR